MIYIGAFDVLKTQSRLWKATTTITGPNDARRVVWALGEFFFISVVFFYLFNDVYRYYGRSKGTEGFSGGNDDDNGPKRRETRRLGPR
jgi:hypothetical protein